MAGLPILSIFFFLFVLKQSSLRSSMLSYIVCLGIVWLSSLFPLSGGEVVHATIKGALICFIVAYVLFFGIFLFHLMNGRGCIEAMAAFISHATHDRLLQVLLLCFGLCPLIESASGFGIGFMVTAPIFLALGFPPLQAALLSFIGLLASSWGALATGTIIGSQLTGMKLAELGAGTALLSTPVFGYFMAAALWLVGGWRAVREKAKELAALFVLFSLSIFLFSKSVSVELAGLLSAVLTTSAGLARIRGKARREGAAYKQHAAAAEGHISILKILSPYLFLTVCILFSRLMPGWPAFLQQHFILHLPSYSYHFALLYSPGFWLCASCLFTILLFRIPRAAVWLALQKTVRQWIPFAVTTTMFISISEMMSASGMHRLLAELGGAAFGALFMLAAPFVGAMGGFLTGSNAGSNAMFIQLQVQTAQHVGLPWRLVAMVQNASSSVSTIACPSRITLGAYLCGIPSRENELLRKTTLLIGGAVVLILIEGTGWLLLSR
nr:L-lactate permease [Ectobacillus ponti]